MANIRHTVIIRKDLQFLPGLLAAQVAHISDYFIRRRLLDSQGEGDKLSPHFTQDELEWLKDPYISVLAVNCAEDLDRIIEQAESENLPVNTWEDTIPSPTFPETSIKVKVGISIGPADFDRIKIVTGALQLY